jgi:uncharacterized protein YjiS (DUF1127 family)
MYQTDIGALPSAHPSNEPGGVFRHNHVGVLAAVIPRFLDGVARHRARRRAILADRSLRELPDHLLRDIGIEPDGRERMSSLLRTPPL